MGDGLDETLRWVEILRGHIGVYKIGKEAFTRFGPEIVRRIQGLGGKIGRASWRERVCQYV
jgi:orotidine-5'-phosphate decarboxylase